jgi:hypothetical protein
MDRVAEAGATLASLRAASAESACRDSTSFERHDSS